MGALWGLSGQQEIGADGLPIVGARAFFYQANTLTPIPVYSDPELTALATNPVVTNGAGRWPLIFINDALLYYRYRLVSPAPENAIWQDALKVPALGPAWWPETSTPSSNSFPTGAMYADPDPSPRATAARANGRTIGSAASGASEMAGPECQALFLKYWNIPTLDVVGGKGPSAAGDWAANKQLYLPDMRGRGFFGLDTMGSSASGRLPDFTTTGQTGGVSTITLSIAQMPAHDHGGTISGGGHVHTYDKPGSTVVNAASTPINGGGFAPANTGGTGEHTHTIPSQGGGGAIENMPPFFVGGWFCQL